MNKKYSNFTATVAIAKASLRSIVRNPSSVVFSLVFPLIFIIVFGFIGGGRSSFDLAITKNSDRDNPVYQKLLQVSSFKITESQDDNAADVSLEKGHFDAVLDIKKNTEGKLPAYIVEIKTNKATPEKSNLCKLILAQIIGGVNTKDLKPEMQVAEIKETDVEGRIFKTIDFILPGQLGFSILSAGVFGTAFVFILLRDTLVIKRFFATPVNRKFIILGEALSRLVFSMSGSIIIILIGHYFFGFTLINGAVTVINMLIVSVLGLLVFLGFGFMVSNMAKSINAVPPIANLITLPQFLLAGTFFSIDNFPSWLQPISRVLPLTYLNDALRKIAFDGATVLTLPKEMLVLLGWGVVVYALAIKFFRWE